MEGQTDNNTKNDLPIDNGALERLEKINLLISELNTELANLEKEGTAIQHQLLGLVDKAKTEKIKQYISNQPD